MEENNLNCFNVMPQNSENSIGANLEKMLGAGNEMLKLLMNESIGGNAGYYKGKSCYAANFHYNGDTGEIDRFTNGPPNRNELHRGTFRLIANVNNPVIIVGTYLDKRSNRSARAVISKTVFMYNIKTQEDFDKSQTNKLA